MSNWLSVLICCNHSSSNDLVMKADLVHYTCVSVPAVTSMMNN